MWEKYRPLLLILVSLGLGALVWLDNHNMLFPEQDVVAASRTVPATPAPAAKSEQPGGSASTPSPAAADPLLNGNPLASFDKATLENWVDRPLFAPSRKR